MRMSNMVIGTLRDVPAEFTRDIDSFKLLLRGGILRKNGSGRFSFLPIGNRVLNNIEYMCIDMLKNNNSEEIVLSKGDFEEVIATFKLDINTYKQLPKGVYCYCNRQIENIKPKFGIIKAKNYRVIKSFKFNLDERSSYDEYEQTKKVILSKLNSLNIDGRYVEAVGEVNGKCEKIIIHSEFGDNSLFTCKKCGYSKHSTIANCKNLTNKENINKLQRVHTPNMKTVEELVGFLKVSKEKIVKTLIYKSEDKIIAVLIRGDREASEAKIRKYLNYTKSLEMGDEKIIFKSTGASIGFAGPIGINIDQLLIDEEIKEMSNFIVGGNETDYHYINVNFERDFIGEIGDFKNIKDGDLCPICGTDLKDEKVLEIGTLYARLKSSDFVYDTEVGSSTEVCVNSYSIGTSRLLGLISEKNRDDSGIIWPGSLAPFDVVIIIAVAKNAEQVSKGEEIYNKLLSFGLRVLLDDRDDRAGAKFKDCDLLGIPFRIIVGKKSSEGLVELKRRSESEVNIVTVDECIEELRNRHNL